LCFAFKLAALSYYSIVPDIIINSDPGYWARFHLMEGLSCSHSNTEPLFLFSSLYGSVPFHSGSSFRHHGLFIEKDSPFAIDNSRVMHLPARGTVAATALDIMLQSSSGPIFFAGLDFSSRDLQSHVRPHTFDKYYFTWSDRFLPTESIRFFRQPLPDHDPLRQYARYFSQLSEEKRVYRILSFCSLRNSSLHELEASSFYDFISNSNQGNRKNNTAFVNQESVGLADSIISAFEKRLNYFLSLNNRDISLLLSRSVRELGVKDMRILNLVSMIDASFSGDFAFLRKQAKIIKEKVRNVGKLNT
jgi:hypothetical protein